MKYTEIKESLKKTEGLIYCYTIEKGFTSALLNVSIDPIHVLTVSVDPESDELVDRIKTGDSTDSWNPTIRVDLYLNTEFGKPIENAWTTCEGWALTEQEAKAIVEQIKSDLKNEQLASLKEQFNREGVTKEDLLNLIEEMK